MAVDFSVGGRCLFGRDTVRSCSADALGTLKVAGPAACGPEVQCPPVVPAAVVSSTFGSCLAVPGSGCLLALLPRGDVPAGGAAAPGSGNQLVICKNLS